MSEVAKTVVRYSRDFSGNLSVDPNGSWVLAADAAINAKRLMNHIDRVTAERDALQQRLTAADERVDERVDRLRHALKFYADGDHLLLSDPDAWDTCSGEPVNFLHDEAGTASVEDGSIAKATLRKVGA